MLSFYQKYTIIKLAILLNPHLSQKYKKPKNIPAFHSQNTRRERLSLFLFEYLITQIMWVLLVPYSFVNWTSFGGKSCFYLYLSFEWPDLIFKGLSIHYIFNVQQLCCFISFAMEVNSGLC